MPNKKSTRKGAQRPKKGPKQLLVLGAILLIVGIILLAANPFSWGLGLFLGLGISLCALGGALIFAGIYWRPKSHADLYKHEDKYTRAYCDKYRTEIYNVCLEHFTRLTQEPTNLSEKDITLYSNIKKHLEEWEEGKNYLFDLDIDNDGTVTFELWSKEPKNLAVKSFLDTTLSNSKVKYDSSYQYNKELGRLTIKKDLLDKIIKHELETIRHNKTLNALRANNLETYNISVDNSTNSDPDKHKDIALSNYKTKIFYALWAHCERMINAPSDKDKDTLVDVEVHSNMKKILEKKDVENFSKLTINEKKVTLTLSTPLDKYIDAVLKDALLCPDFGPESSYYYDRDKGSITIDKILLNKFLEEESLYNESEQEDSHHQSSGRL